LSSAGAGVVVLTSRAKDKVAFTVVQPDGRQSRQELLYQDVISLPTAGSVTVAFLDGALTRRYLLRANGIYYFRSEGTRLDLLQQPIPGLSPLPANSPAPRPSDGPPDSLYTISVKILADEKEPRVRRLWEKEYRQRIAAASAIFERCCRIRFQVVAVETWNSGNNVHDFLRLMNDFEAKVKPDPARLAIGFTGQYAGLQEDQRMGGARGPFRSHVLVREWGRDIADSERLEILVHELGHYLGAPHSAEPQSVMRPDFSDRQSRARSYRIRFDATNTLVMCLLDDEFRHRPFEHLGQLPSAVKDQLRPLYRSLAAALPNDPAAPRYLSMLDQSLGLAGAAADHRRAVIAGARSVVQAVTEAARQNDQLPMPGRLPTGRQARREGDRLTEFYVRAAATAAKRLPRDVAGEAFLLGLGVALDDAPLLPSLPVLGDFWRQIEPPPQRTERLAVLGSPTMRGRHDSAQHFALAAALTALVGPQGAEGAGVVKEVSDSQGGSGFSFVDLMSDLAGVAFATAVSDGHLSLSRLETAFSVADFLPAPDGLKEGIAWSDFVAAYGSSSDSRWLRQRQAIRARILVLAGYAGMPYRP
jgi:hypothetical protein